jgi:hypothetical protein
MKYNFGEDKLLKDLFFGSVFITLFLFCIDSEVSGKDYLEELYSIKTLDRYTFATISQSGDYTLLQNPTAETIAETPEGSEFVPGGVKRLYNKQGSLIWKKMYPGFLEFCSNEDYLMEASLADFKGPFPPTIYYRKNGALFFRMPEEKPEVYSFDVNSTGDMIVAGLRSGKVILMRSGKEIWNYSIGMPVASVDAVFSKDGKYFLEGLNSTLFAIGKDGVIHKMNVNLAERKPSSFRYRDLKDSVHFVLARERIDQYASKIYQFVPDEKKLFFLDLSYVAEAKRKFVVKELKNNYRIYPKEIIFSKFLDHVGVITTGNGFYYFKIKEK